MYKRLFWTKIFLLVFGSHWEEDSLVVEVKAILGGEGRTLKKGYFWKFLVRASGDLLWRRRFTSFRLADHSEQLPFTGDYPDDAGSTSIGLPLYSFVHSLYSATSELVQKPWNQIISKVDMLMVEMMHNIWIIHRRLNGHYQEKGWGTIAKEILQRKTNVTTVSIQFVKQAR